MPKRKGTAMRPEPYTENYRQLSSAEFERSSSPGKSTASASPIAKVLPENMHTRTTVQTEQASFRNVYLYTYIHILIHVKTTNKNEAMNLKEGKEGYM